ncbi:MAG TPA: OmpA family protein [Methylomirabilota bacterium]|jgi:peptidoglycan-associated lipoprotein
MASIRVLALLIVLVLGVGCQATRKAQSDLAASTVESAAVTTRVEPPDADALSPGSSPPPPQEFVAVARLADIHFDYDAHEIRPADMPTLDENAVWLKENPTALLLIEGHTDERGTNEYNLGLGDLRAAAAMSYLIARGVPAARMVAISYGKERPVCTDPNETCWAQNRRAHFLAKPR